MCGLAGILSANGCVDRLEDRILWMQAAIANRGPDDQGHFIAASQTVALAHTRLAILDLSTAGHQPMTLGDGRYWIVFNGEIYNFRELRSQLLNQGEQFQSHTDTEVILKLYQRLGSDCVHQLRGMFAFAIWDEQEQTGFLARDPLGIKPLYYWRSDVTLAFASEVKALLASRLPSIHLSREGLYGYLVSGTVPEPYTLIEGIQCLPAGHWLRWQRGQVTQQSYWQIQFVPEPMDTITATDKVRAALVDSIKHHFVSDVPVGLFLSGGIDSSSVLALAAQTQSQTLNTYSITFEEQEWNEGELAQKVATVFGAHHTEFCLTATMGRALFSKYLEAIDQPSIDGLNTFCVSQVARQAGSKVVLSGLGGDELFGGYRSFRQIPQMVQTLQRLCRVSALARGMGQCLERWGTSGRQRRIGDFLQQPPSAAAAYRSFRGIFSHQEACTVLRHYLPEQSLPSRISPTPQKTDLSLVDQVSALELSCYMRNQLLRDSDVMSMAWGLELRVPLVDQPLVETLATIPSSLRLAPGKQLLTQAVPELPDWLINQPKRGFYFPFPDWINRDWHPCFANVERFRTIQLEPWYRRWSLALLDYWWDQTTA